MCARMCVREVVCVCVYVCVCVCERERERERKRKRMRARCMYICACINTYMYIYIYIYIYIFTYGHIRTYCIHAFLYIFPLSGGRRGYDDASLFPSVSLSPWHHSWYGVTSISRLLEIIGLFCKRALLKRRYSAKETYFFKKPTHSSHPISKKGINNVYHILISQLGIKNVN